MQIILDNGSTIVTKYAIGELFAHKLGNGQADMVTGVAILGNGGVVYHSAATEGHLFEIEMVEYDPEKDPMEAGGYGEDEEGEDENLG